MAAELQVEVDESCTILSTEIASAEERAGQKKGKAQFVFKIEVDWSNGSKTTCYRTYNDFYDLQCKLLDAFPEEAGSVKGTERKLPFLPGKQMFRRSTKQLALERLPQLDQYLKDLISLTNVTQCSHVRWFLAEVSGEVVQFSTSQKIVPRDLKPKDHASL